MKSNSKVTNRQWLGEEEDDGVLLGGRELVERLDHIHKHRESLRNRKRIS